MENGKKNNGENSGPLTSLPVDRLTPTARANFWNALSGYQPWFPDLDKPLDCNFQTILVR